MDLMPVLANGAGIKSESWHLSLKILEWGVVRSGNFSFLSGWRRWLHYFIIFFFFSMHLILYSEVTPHQG